MTLEDAYCDCVSGGKYIPQEKPDINKIQSMLKIADEDFDTAKLLNNTKEPKYNTIYKLHYDVLHTLTEALLRFDKIKSSNHQCLFAYLCKNHPDLELDWNFFEKIRTKRNGMQYYGSLVDKRDWKEIELQTYLYIKTIKNSIDMKINEFKN